MSADRARQYLEDPLIQGFDKQMRESLYMAFESANERDVEHLKNLSLMAKSHKKFMDYLRSFIETEKIDDMAKKAGVIDSVAAFIKRQK